MSEDKDNTIIQQKKQVSAQDMVNGASPGGYPPP